MGKKLINLAIREAIKGYKKNEVPVGAIIVDEDKNIISRAHNLVETHNNPCSHAEILAIKKACDITGKRYLNNCSMWVTLEPCIMCAGHILQSRLKYLYFGLEDKKSGSIENGLKIFYNQHVKSEIEIYFGFEEERIKKLMKKFFINTRK